MARIRIFHASVNPECYNELLVVVSQIRDNQVIQNDI